jgi:hypothetical protein
VLCPWCLHYGAEDDEYLFDAELYCGLCAQQMPRGRDGWLAAFGRMSPEMLSYVEEELNKIAVSKSGLQPDLLSDMGEAIARLADVRQTGSGTQPPEEYARWVEFACTYYTPNVR